MSMNEDRTQAGTNKIEIGLQRYVDYYEALSPDTVEELRNIATSDMYFKDPFNEVRNVEHVIRIMKHMYETSDTPRFKVLDSVLSGQTAYLKWDFYFQAKSLNKGKEIKVVGMSELLINEAGLIASHVDYWDAAEQLYEYVPVLGGIIRLVKKNLKVS
jgi:hypothetical protein